MFKKQSQFLVLQGKGKRGYEEGEKWKERRRENVMGRRESSHCLKSTPCEKEEDHTIHVQS